MCPILSYQNIATLTPVYKTVIYAIVESVVLPLLLDNQCYPYI